MDNHQSAGVAEPDGLANLEQPYWHPVYNEDDEVEILWFTGDECPPPKYLEKINSLLLDLSVEDQRGRVRIAASGLSGRAVEWAQGKEWSTYAKFKRDFLRPFWSKRMQLEPHSEIEYGRWSEWWTTGIGSWSG